MLPWSDRKRPWPALPVRHPRCRVFNPHGTYGGQGKAAGLRDAGGFAVLNAAGIARGALRLSFAATPPAADGWDRPMCAMVCLAVGCAIKNGSHQEPFYPHERYAIIERMKTGDKAFLRLDGVVCVGTVKRAFLSPFGVPSVWIEWPKDNPCPSRNISMSAI
jgi:hypothetical protein